MILTLRVQGSNVGIDFEMSEEACVLSGAAMGAQFFRPALLELLHQTNRPLMDKMYGTAADLHERFMIAMAERSC